MPPQRHCSASPRSDARSHVQEVREPLDAFQLDQLQRIFALLGAPSEAAWPALAHAAHWAANTQGVRDVRPEHAPCLEAHLLACNPGLAQDRRKDAAVDLLTQCEPTLAFR